MEFSIQQIANLLQAELIGDGSGTVSGVSKIEEGKAGTLSFLANAQYAKYLNDTGASVVLISKSLVPENYSNERVVLLVVENAYEAFASLMQAYVDSQPQKRGIEANCMIADTATLGSNCYVGGYAYIDGGAKIGNNVKIYPHVYVGEGVTIGDDTTLFPGSKVYAGCQIGAHCVIHGGAVIGADGFGFAVQSDTLFQKVPQLGNVIIEDYVEIGANTTIDRATIGSTRIRKGAKLDNLIQVAHNVDVGENTGIAAQTGIAGSSKIGSSCMIGGQVGISGHISVGDNVKIAAQSGIQSEVNEESVVQGSPAFDRMAYQKSYVVFRQLPEWSKRIAQLEKKLNNIEHNSVIEK